MLLRCDRGSSTVFVPFEAQIATQELCAAPLNVAPRGLDRGTLERIEQHAGTLGR